MEDGVRASLVCGAAIVAALSVGSFALAQEPPAPPAPPAPLAPRASASPAPPAAPRPTPPKVLTSPEPDYPDALKAVGAQGEVVVGGLVRADGTLVDPVVKTGSRVPDLDRLALDAFRTWTFKPGLDVDGKPMDAPVSTRIAFRKDSITTMGTKTCAEFVLDQDWFKGVWPEEDARSPLYYLTLGLFTLIAMNKGSTAGVLPMIRAFGPAWDKTYATCKKKPDALYIKVLTKAL